MSLETIRKRMFSYVKVLRSIGIYIVLCYHWRPKVLLGASIDFNSFMWFHTRTNDVCSSSRNMGPITHIVGNYFGVFDLCKRLICRPTRGETKITLVNSSWRGIRAVRLLAFPY